ncbi:MAG: DAK2 domain-containing protein, partial [Paracoccaceae bacterium]
GLLAADTSVQAWPGMRAFSAPVTVPLPAGLAPLPPSASANAANRALLVRGCEVLIAAEADLNALDAKSGDGDTGSTLATAARALIARADQLPLADLTQLHKAIGQELSQTIGGSSGVLLAILFAATGDALSRGLGLVAAFKAGLARVQEVGGAKPGDRTMIDALLPALDALPDGFGEAASAARTGARLTASMSRAQAGRAAYLSAESLCGQVDPGAEAVARLFEGLSRLRA